MKKEMCVSGLTDEAKKIFEKLLTENGNVTDLNTGYAKSKNEIALMQKVVLNVCNHAELNAKFSSDYQSAWTAVKYIFNITGYILYASLDIKNCNQMLVNAKDKSQRIYICRTSCVLVHETLKGLMEITGKSFRNKICDIKADSLLQEFDTSRNLLSTFNKNHGEYISWLRNNIGAHRADKNFSVFHEISESLDYVEFFGILMHFEETLNNFALTTQKIMNASVNYIQLIHTSSEAGEVTTNET